MRTDERGVVVLPTLPAATAADILSAPRLAGDALARLPLAEGAARLRVPVLLRAPAGAPRLLLARALHTAAGQSGPFVALTGRRPAFTSLPADATVAIDVGQLPPEGVVALEAALDDAAAWVIAGSEPDAVLPSSLAARLAAVVLPVAPLHTRLAELPAVAESLLVALARRAGGPAPRLSPDALASLATHAWPGDVAELEVTLARAWLIAGGDTIGAEHLAFGGEPAATAPVNAFAAPAPAHAAELELLLAELAHEVRNPFVTIKTFADHLPELMNDAALRERFAALANEGIARIDGLLENVIEFARLGAPRTETIELGPLLDRLLAEVEPALTERAVRVRRERVEHARCMGDPSHVAYALRNLFAGVLREVPPREDLAIETNANGVVTLRFAGSAQATAHLKHLTGPPGGAAVGDPTFLPLVFRLARQALERNGGALGVVPEAGAATTLVVRLPAVG